MKTTEEINKLDFIELARTRTMKWFSEEELLIRCKAFIKEFPHEAGIILLFLGEVGVNIEEEN